MSRILKFLLYSMWEKNKGPGNLYVWFFIFALMAAYAAMFPFLVEIFGTTTRVFPAIYLAIAALSWGIRGAIPVAVLNIALNILLYRHAGRPFEGGFLGPAGNLFATALMGMVSDLVRQLVHQLRQREAIEVILKDSEERYRRIFNMASDAILLTDDESGRILEANESATRIYGYTHGELLTMRSIEISAEPDHTRTAILEHRKHVPIRNHKKKNGLVFPAEITAEHFTMKNRRVQVIAIRDISSRLKTEEEKKRLEAQFYQAQKMESIGTLAGGIAHDFNNLLGGIMGHASLVLMKITADDPIHENLSVIKRLTENGGKLTKHLLGFARGGKYAVKATNLNELISHHDLVFGRTHKHIGIGEKLADDLWAVDVDRGQIEQVLFNIYINSAQAMPEKGSIFVETENMHLQKTDAFQFTVEPGEYVRVSVRDTGSGMDETTRSRIFEPFFSTKEKGVGTGLGMAASYGIVKNHGGYIQVLSELERGTTVTIFLPRSKKECEPEADTTPPAVVLETGSGTILVVDDEEDILAVVSDMLQVLGYDVLTAEGGREAVSVFQENKDKIDLVLLDMIMPELNGLETFARLKEIDRDVKVLFQTGYSLHQARKQLDFLKGTAGIIRKPFTINGLSGKIKTALNPCLFSKPRRSASSAGN